MEREGASAEHHVQAMLARFLPGRAEMRDSDAS